MYSRNDKLVMRIIGMSLKYIPSKIFSYFASVHLIFLLDTVQTCFSMDDTFFYFVYGFGNVERLFELHWAFDVPTIDAVIGLIVQGVYCWRIWVLSGWRVIPIFSALVSLDSASVERTKFDNFCLDCTPRWCFRICRRGPGKRRKAISTKNQR